MSKRRWLPWIVALVVIVLGIGGAVIGWIWAEPLAFHTWQTRQALFKDGFVEGAVAGYQGTVVYLHAEPEGGAPTLVFLHGAGDQAGAWSQVAPAFTDRYRVVIPDLAGHGDSAPLTGPLPFDAVVEGFEALMAKTQPDYQGKAILVGNSMGAWVASIYAQRHPDRVARLVLVDGGPIRGESDLSLMPENREQAEKLMAALRAPSSPAVPGFVLDDIVQHARSGPIGRLAQAPASMEKYLLDDRLDEIKVPVDLIWGKDDQLLSPAYAERLAAGLPRARITWMDDCGHVPENECPERFTETLAAVLAQPAPAATEDEPAAMEDEPAAREVAPAATGDEPAATQDEPAAPGAMASGDAVPGGKA